MCALVYGYVFVWGIHVVWKRTVQHKIIITMKHQKHWWWNNAICSSYFLMYSKSTFVVWTNNHYLLKVLWLLLWDDSIELDGLEWIHSNVWSFSGNGCDCWVCWSLYSLYIIVLHSSVGYPELLHIVMEVLSAVRKSKPQFASIFQVSIYIIFISTTVARASQLTKLAIQWVMGE